MTKVIDDYREKIITLGDEGSDLLKKLCTLPTLDNCDFIEVLNDNAVLRIPENSLVVVHSAGGNPSLPDLGEYAASVVHRLVDQASRINATPVAFADVIDSHSGEKGMLEIIAHSLVRTSHEYGLAIMNGENAVLGARVNPEAQANIMGTMISLVEKGNTKIEPGEIFYLDGHAYAVFDPKGKAVLINCDGIGTKTEFYERILRYELGINDFLAMGLDDTVKSGAEAMAVSGAVETRGIGAGLIRKIVDYARKRGEEMGFMCTLQPEAVGNRIRGYSDSAASYNISGSVVSVIDEERLLNPLRPREGESLIAIAGKPNPRSNGITKRREIAIAMLGANYHETEEGKILLEYLAEPSTVLYPVFKKLVDSGLATSVYHMSGGAYKGKLAVPLAKHDLFAEIEGQFPPHPMDIEMAKFMEASPESIYTQWGMGTDGLASSAKQKEAIAVIQEMGFKAREVAKLQKIEGKTGVALTAFDGSMVAYSGKD